MKFNKIDIYNYCIILIATFPLLGLKKSSVAIIIFAVLSIIIFATDKNKRTFTKKDSLNLFVLTSFYLGFLISFIFSQDKASFVKTLVQNLSFLIFPLFLILNQKFVLKTTLNKTLNVFILSNVAIALYIWCIIFCKGVAAVFKQNTYYNPIIRNLFNHISEIHLPYLGLFFVFSSLILVNKIFENPKNKIFINVIRTIGIAVLMISVIAFAARVAVSLFIIAVVLIAFKNISNLKRKLIFISMFLIATFALLSSPPFKNRIKELTNTKLILPTMGQPSEEVNFRYGIYSCVYEILKDNWLLGVGVENVQDKLNSCYGKYTYQNFDDFKNTTYNSHNQYLDIILKYGIFGLVLFFIFLLWGIKNNDFNYQIFIFLTLMSLISENIFDRQVGIVFFNLLNSLFFISMVKKSKLYI